VVVVSEQIVQSAVNSHRATKCSTLLEKRTMTVSVIVAKRYHATWGLTPAVFRLVPVRLKWLYWAIFDPAFPQCLHHQYRWHIRILEQQYAASTVLTLFNDRSWEPPSPSSQLQLGASPHLLRQVTWPPLVPRLRACLGWIRILSTV